MQLEAIFSNILREPIESMSDETSPGNTRAWDSLKHIELVLAIEGAYSVKFSMPEITSLNSLGSVRQLYDECVKLQQKVEDKKLTAATRKRNGTKLAKNQVGIRDELMTISGPRRWASTSLM